MLSEQELVRCLRKAGCIGTVKMSFESGPYSIDKPSINASRLCEAIESAACAERDKRIAELERELEQARQQMERQKDEWLSWEAKRKALESAAVELEAVRKDDEQIAALRVLSYAAGVAAGWNYCVNDDNDSFQRAQDTSEALRVLKKHSAAMKEQK